MTNTKLEKLASKQSRTNGVQYVVYVPDEGGDVYNADQLDIYRGLVFVESIFVDGMKISDIHAFTAKA